MYLTLPLHSDLQMVQISLRVLTRPEVGALPSIYRTLGEGEFMIPSKFLSLVGALVYIFLFFWPECTDYDEKVLPSIVNEVLKQVIAEHTAPQLLTQREQVSKKIRRNLTERAAQFNLVLEDVSITDLQFGREFTAAVEAKQVAQQDAERARFIVEKAEQDRKSIVIRAEAEAETAKLIGEAVKNNPGFVNLRRIDAAKDISQSLSQSANTIYLSSDSLLLNLMSGGGLTESEKEMLAEKADRS